MNTDLWIALMGFGGLFVGYVIGRYERQDVQTKTYRHGYNIGRQVGRNEGK